MASPTLTLGNREILKLANGLRALDGVSNDTAKIERYNFDDSLTWNIAKNRDIVERAEVFYSKRKAKTASELGIVEKMKLTDENAPKVAAFIDKEQTLLEQTQELTGILKLSRKKLFEAGVKIPGIYSELMPILID